MKGDIRIDKKGLKTGVWSAVIGTLCCTTPLAIVLLGIGGLSAALAISSLKPVFALVAAVFAVMALALHFRKRYGSCGIGTFKKNKNMVLTTAVTSVVLYFFILNVALPAVSPVILPAQEKPTTGAAELRQASFQVDGLSCASCASAIRQRLLTTGGVYKAEVGEDGKGCFVYDPRQVTKEQVASLAGDGKPTSVLSDEKGDTCRS
ncbi:cation transporter [Candidatus Micrarchaeota archaeon]|nr:cation transporter [Candidatus Micrarchaeota archaeon]